MSIGYMSVTASNCPDCMVTGGYVPCPQHTPKVSFGPQPFRCPVCEGCGTVPADFYARVGVGSSINREQCRSCSGSGVIWG